MKIPVVVVFLTMIFIACFAMDLPGVRLVSAWGAPVASNNGQKFNEPDLIEVPVVQDVTSAGGGIAPKNIKDLFSRFHPSMTHMPIALSCLLLLMEIFSLIFKKPWAQCGMFVHVVAFLSCLPAVATGLLRAGQIAGQNALSHETVTHRNLAIAAGSFLLVSLAVRIAERDHLQGSARGIYIIMVSLSVILFAAAGHWGGSLVFGEDYLDFEDILRSAGGSFSR